ncbi:helix-turn-helix domain-containing protein [Allisonella histaminiformans]|uniref:helix-turn-helix domain-containing protein n=1 Tax=Allisonella histaminiformans TaxID=209880 RepID=UPI0026F2F3B4|nr:helix-turn-helix domain-containing protein [Allisonella histaminiformans]
MKSNLENVITAAEAEAKWGEWPQGRFSRHVLAIKVVRSRFTKEKARKSGGIWLVTRRAWIPVWP